jgi:hypothetical protein
VPRATGYAPVPGLMVEIKAVNKYAHADALAGKVPKIYEDQVWHLLLVTGAKLCHYISYSPQQQEAYKRLAVVAVKTDKAQLDELF